MHSLRMEPTLLMGSAPVAQIGSKSRSVCVKFHNEKMGYKYARLLQSIIIVIDLWIGSYIVHMYKCVYSYITALYKTNIPVNQTY